MHVSIRTILLQGYRDANERCMQYKYDAARRDYTDNSVCVTNVHVIGNLFSGNSCV